MEKIDVKIGDLVLVNSIKVSVIVKVTESRFYYCTLTRSTNDGDVILNGKQKYASYSVILTKGALAPIAKTGDAIPYSSFTYTGTDGYTSPCMRRVTEDFLLPSEKEAYEFFKSHI